MKIDKLTVEINFKITWSSILRASFARIFCREYYESIVNKIESDVKNV